jgi:molecular chaperone Hsp33
VRPFDVRALRHRCRCNEDRVLGLLAAFTADEIAELSVEGVVTVTCQFCNRRYRYEPAELHRKLTARREAAP